MRLTSTSPDSSRPLGSIYGLGAVYTGPYRNHLQSLRPQFDGEDDGGDGGAGAGDGGDGGGGGDADAVADAAAQAAAHKFADTKGYVQLPGMDKPVKVADLATALSLRNQSESSLKMMTQIAAAFKKQQEQGAGDGKGGKRTTPPPKAADTETKDVLDQLEAMELLDGKTAAGVLKQFRDGTVTPLVKAVVAMAKEMQGLRQGLGTIGSERAEAQFTALTSDVVTSLKLPKMADTSALDEMIRDFYASFDEADKPKLNAATLAKEFSTQFKSRRAFFKALDRAELDAAQARRRQNIFAKPGANTTTTGDGKGKPKRMMTNRDFANALFDGAPAET